MPYKDPEKRKAMAALVSKRWAELNRDKKREQSRLSYERNRNAVLARTKERQLANPEKVNEYARRWRARNPDKVRALVRAHQKANPELWAAYAKRYRERHPEKARAANRLSTREYDAKKRGRPAWVDRQELLAVYVACPEGFHVDHIVPLGGPKRPALTAEGYPISGLHVPWNLQFLPKEVNLKKQLCMSLEDVALCERVSPTKHSV